jgi:cell division protein FtsA
MEHGNEKIVVGLDIGTTKVCAVVASINEQNRIHILGVGKAPSEGLNRGVVINIDKTVHAIRTAIQQAELASGIQVNSVNVGIAGDHIRSIRSKGVITINNKEKEITVQDVERILKDCQQIMLPPDQQILHVIPQEFVVDGQDGISDPVGMSGMRMEAEVHIITGLVSAAKNLYRCVERAGYQVADIILEPLASSYAVLDDEEKEAGVVLVDIGGGTTDLAVFQENTIRHTAVIAIAGKKVTDDIKIGLSVLDEQAQKLKHNHGECFVDLIDNDEVITIPGIAGRPPKEITKSILSKIIQARMEEILEIIAIEVKRSGYADSLSAGIVITGGGSLIKNICPLANEVLGMDAKIGRPMGLAGGLIEEVNSPIYATSVGLVLHALKADGTDNQQFDPSAAKASGVGEVIGNITERMKSWFKEL